LQLISAKVQSELQQRQGETDVAVFERRSAFHS
jgi:hypothetical protein